MQNKKISAAVKKVANDYNVRITRQGEAIHFIAYVSADKVKAEGVCEFINHMHPETREGWFNAWMEV